MNDRGSLAILISGYLALILTLFLGGCAVALGLIAQNRIQGVADSAILYGHDRAATRGVPNPEKLERAISHFLDNAPSAKQLTHLSFDSSVVGVKSTIALCARHQDPIGKYVVGRICRQANAESFLVD
jgi:hypothetical protein